MTGFARAVEEFRVGLLLRAALDNRGSMCAAARLAGLHRNTVRRILRQAGYDAARIKQLLVIERSRKGPVSVHSAEAFERRCADGSL